MVFPLLCLSFSKVERGDGRNGEGSLGKINNEGIIGRSNANMRYKGSLCCDTADEAKTLIPSLQDKISDDDLTELLDEITKLMGFTN